MKLHRKTPRKEFPKPNLLVRIEHKKAIRLNAVAAELDRKHPEPMMLFHKREKAGEIPAFPRKPEITRGEASQAAEAMAAWDNSDPFAYGRTFLHVKQGYLNSREVVEEMHKRTVARKIAKAREVDRAKQQLTSSQG